MNISINHNTTLNMNEENTDTKTDSGATKDRSATSCSPLSLAIETLKKSLLDWNLLKQYEDMGSNGNRTIAGQVEMHEATLKILKENVKDHAPTTNKI